MIILNEKEYAEECIKNGVINKKPLFTIHLLAKYYWQVQGYRKKQIIEALTSYLDTHYPSYVYDREYWIDQIEHAAKNASKRKLYENDGVVVTESELETISSLNNKVLERLAFTILCISKLNNARNPNNNGWVRTDDKEVFKLARISDSVSDRQMRIGKLYLAGLVELPKRIDNLSYRVTYVDDNSPAVLIISDFRELGYEYLLYKGENFIRCGECGILTRGNKNGTKRYCAECAAYTPMETKVVSCIDCGEPFEIVAKNHQSHRCPFCYDQYRRAYKRQNEQRRRNKMKNVDSTNLG